jgi:hypothetical protein
MKAFISYSHEDEASLNKLLIHLAALRRQGLIEAWTDHEIHAGADIDERVESAMEEAQLFLLLVSASFINSDYCFEKEFARALERQAVGEVLIVPIIVRECDWKIQELRKFKALPKDGKAVISRHWHSEDEAFANIAEGLRALLEITGETCPAAPNPAVEGIPMTDVPQINSEFAQPSHAFAKELLEMILEHPNEDERGLTEILHDSPVGVLYRAFIPNTTAAGGAPSVKKSLFGPAVAELVRLGWLLQPEGNSRVRIYELNPETKGMTS